MRISAAGAHFRGDPDGLHDFLARRAMTQRSLGMTANAIGALRHMRHRNGNQLLGLRRQRPTCENLPAEVLKRFFGLGRQSPPLLRELTGQGRVYVSSHAVLLILFDADPVLPEAAPCS